RTGRDRLPQLRGDGHGGRCDWRPARLGGGARAATAAEMTPRLTEAPITPTLLRLSAPGLLLVAFQSMVSVGDTYFVGRLGTAPLAGLALVFPLLMLLQMTSAGAMEIGRASCRERVWGAGVAGAVKR